MRICTDVRLSMQTNNTRARGRAQWTSIAESVYARNQQCMRNDVRNDGCFASTISLFGLASHQVAISVTLFRYQESIYKGHVVGKFVQWSVSIWENLPPEMEQTVLRFMKSRGSIGFYFYWKTPSSWAKPLGQKTSCTACRAVARNSFRGGVQPLFM